MLDINEKLGIGHDSTPPDDSDYPLINALFFPDNTLFINLFHTKTTTNWHFTY